MKTRLQVAKQLLAPNGSIFVHLDWNEVHYCKILMDEIFGRDNFRNEIIWCYNGPGSPKMKQLNRKHDNILWYSNSPDTWVFNGEDIRLESSVHQGGFNGEMDSSISGEYTQKGKIPEDWWTLFHTTEDLEDEIEQLKNNNAQLDINGDWLKAAVAARIRVDGKKRTGYATEKPYKLMERLIAMVTKPGDLVLDFFAGSGTTGYSANRLGRRFILVEQLSNTVEILKTRFQGTKVVFADLAVANQSFKEKIELSKSTSELNNIWTDMQKTGFLSWKIRPNEIDEHASDFRDLSLEDQKRFLIECLDKNMLYIPLSEIENNEFGVSEEDKKLNNIFYGNS